MANAIANAKADVDVATYRDGLALGGELGAARAVTHREGLEVAWREVTPGAWGFMLRGSRGEWVPWHSAPLLMRVMSAHGIPALARDVRRQVQACLENGPQILAALRAWDREPFDAPGCGP